MPPAIVDQAEESLEEMVQEIAIAILFRGQLGSAASRRLSSE